jgi:ribosome biogenesis protein ERB1
LSSYFRSGDESSDETDSSEYSELEEEEEEEENDSEEDDEEDGDEDDDDDDEDEDDDDDDDDANEEESDAVKSVEGRGVGLPSLKDKKDVSKVDGALNTSSKSQPPSKKQVRSKASSGLKLVKPKTPENGASTTSEENEAGSSQVGVSKKEDEYAYDSSDEEDIRNTIGNIPTNWYDEYGHIGYDLEGKKIRKGHIFGRIP